ncbi:MAG: 30S ribosomal protein S8e [Thaumarchaeota archaeon]|nr:30S ribosomal protein S8e [Nitrososphaerota archaeon]
MLFPAPPDAGRGAKPLSEVAPPREAVKKPYENLEKRKVTGGRRRASRGRRKHERDGYPTETVLGEHAVRVKRTRGGGRKVALVSDQFANVVVDARLGQSKRAKILRVIANPADRDYERRGVISKGALIETDAGVARVTSRPSQDGVINAVLVEGKRAPGGRGPPG